MDWIIAQFHDLPGDEANRLRTHLRVVLTSDWWNNPAANPINDGIISDLLRFFINGRCTFCNTERTQSTGLSCIKDHLDYPN